MTTTAPPSSYDSTVRAAASTPRPRAPLSLRVWHRLLSAGTGPAAEWYGFDRLIRWRAYSAAQKRLELVKLLKSPLRAVREARWDIDLFGDEVERMTGVSKARQLRQLWWLKVRYGIRGRAYLVFQLYRPERFARARDYIQEAEFFRNSRFLSARRWPEDARTFWERRPFEELCRRHDIPTVPILLELRDGRVAESIVPGGGLPAHDIFTKPVESTGGEGAARWMHDGAGGFVGRDGRRRSADELLAELAAMSLQVMPKTGQRRAIVVKELVRNHRDLLPLTPAGLCTVRMITVRMPGEQPRLMRAVYKMPMGDSPADNFVFGGVAASVDIERGTLGPAVFKVGRVLTTVTDHPGTGARIDGRPIPWWTEAVALACRAHAALPDLAYVGWDIAILDRGPVVIEGNSTPNPELTQEPSGEPMGDSAIIACMNAHLRDELGFA